MGAERFDLVFVDFHLHDGARSRSVLSDDNAVFPVSANEDCMVVIVDLPLIWICAATLWVATGDARSFVVRRLCNAETQAMATVLQYSYSIRRRGRTTTSHGVHGIP